MSRLETTFAQETVNNFKQAITQDLAVFVFEGDKYRWHFVWDKEMGWGAIEAMGDVPYTSERFAVVHTEKECSIAIVGNSEEGVYVISHNEYEDRGVPLDDSLEIAKREDPSLTVLWDQPEDD